MSDISTLFDKIKARLEAILPDHAQLVDPYTLENNPEKSLQKGWGIIFGPGTNTNRRLSCQLSVQRNIIIPITRRRTGNDLAASKNEGIEKLLMEDHFTVVKDFETHPDLKESGDIAKFGYVSDGGIENIFSGEDTYITTQLTFEAEYFEDLTTP